MILHSADSHKFNLMQLRMPDLPVSGLQAVIHPFGPTFAKCSGWLAGLWFRHTRLITNQTCTGIANKIVRDWDQPVSSRCRCSSGVVVTDHGQLAQSGWQWVHGAFRLPDKELWSGEWYDTMLRGFTSGTYCFVWRVADGTCHSSRYCFCRLRHSGATWLPGGFHLQMMTHSMTGMKLRHRRLSYNTVSWIVEVNCIQKEIM